MSNVASLANLRLPWKPGESGNPGGKAKGARDRLQADFLHALASDFAAHGVEAIQKARAKNPVGYMRAIVSLMPKIFDVTDPAKVDIVYYSVASNIEPHVIERLTSKLAARIRSKKHTRFVLRRSGDLRQMAFVVAPHSMKLRFSQDPRPLPQQPPILNDAAEPQYLALYRREAFEWF